VGVVSVVDLVSHDLDVLSTKSGVSYRELAAIRRVLLAEHAAPVVAGTTLFDVVVATTSIVSVGIGVLDNLLGGGILTGEITEVVTDRSYVSDALVMNTIVTVVTAMDKNVVYVDTSNNFDVRRFADVLAASQRNVDVESAMKRVKIAKCFDMMQLLGQLSALCESSRLSNDSFHTSLKLIVLDGIVDNILLSMSHIPSNSGCGYVSQLVHLLHLLTTDFCYAVLLCNGDVMSYNGNSARLCRLWHSVPDTRLSVVDITTGGNGTDSRMFCGQMKLSLSKSNRLPVGQSVELEVNEHRLFT